jgi:hypothetical protein
MKRKKVKRKGAKSRKLTMRQAIAQLRNTDLRQLALDPQECMELADVANEEMERRMNAGTFNTGGR